MDFCCEVSKEDATHYISILDNRTGRVVHELFVMVPDGVPTEWRASAAIEQAIHFNPECMAPGRSISVYEVRD